MTDPVDEWVAMSVNEFDGTPLKSVLTGDLPEDDEEVSEEEKKAKDEALPLITWMGELLSTDVAEVRASKRLTDSPSVLVDKAGAWARTWSASSRRRTKTSVRCSARARGQPQPPARADAGQAEQ